MYRIGGFIRQVPTVFCCKEFAQLVCILSTEEVPGRAPRLTIGARRCVEHNIDGVGDIHVKTSTSGTGISQVVSDGAKALTSQSLGETRLPPGCHGGVNENTADPVKRTKALYIFGPMSGLAGPGGN